MGAAAAAPPVGAPPPLGANLDNNLGGSAPAPGAVQAVTDGSVETEAGSGVGGLHAFSTAVVGALVLALALVL